jgi:hypothetical protein
VLSDETLVKAILSEDVIQALAKYIRYEHGLKVDPSTLNTKVEALLGVE